MTGIDPSIADQGRRFSAALRTAIDGVRREISPAVPSLNALIGAMITLQAELVASIPDESARKHLRDEIKRAYPRMLARAAVEARKHQLDNRPPAPYIPSRKETPPNVV